MGFLKFMKKQEEARQNRSTASSAPSRSLPSLPQFMDIPPLLPSGDLSKDTQKKGTKDKGVLFDLPLLPPFQRPKVVPPMQRAEIRSPFNLPEELQNPFEEPPRAKEDTRKVAVIPLLPSSTRRKDEFTLPEFPDIGKLRELDEETLVQMFGGEKHEFNEKEVQARETEQRELARLHAKSDFVSRKEPLFVNVAGFKAVLGTLDGIRNELQAGQSILDRMNEIKNSQDAEFTRWERSMEDIERKLMYLDTVIFETKQYS